MPAGVKDRGMPEAVELDSSDPEVAADRRHERVIPQVSDALWRDLLQAADVVREVAPWEKISGIDQFGLVDPVSNETTIGLIVGSRVSFRGVQLYLQPEGVQFLNKTLYSDRPKATDLRCRNRIVWIEFVAKGMLAPHELALRDHLKFPRLPNKGRPFARFRSIRPMCVPWFVDETEARLLVLAAYASLAHCDTFDPGKPDEDIRLSEDRRPIISIFALRKDRDPSDLGGAWDRTEAAMPRAKEAFLGVITEETKGRLRILKIEDTAPWQIGVVIVDEPFDNWERPYFPRIVLVVDAVTEAVRALYARTPEMELADQFSQALAFAGERAGFLPPTIEVKSASAQKIMGPLGAELGIEIKRRGIMPAWMKAAEAVPDFPAKVIRGS